MSQPQQAMVKTDEQAGNIVSLYTGLSTKTLKRKVDKMAEQRQIINKFVSDQLKEGKDFGTIDGTSRSGSSFKSKPTLFKPGMEKIFSLFGLTTELEKDVQTLEMLPDQTNLVAFKCNVYKGGVKIAEGRGAGTIGDLNRDANATIKIAEKRARMDACLSLGFSEFFTQDMDDPDYRNGNGSSPTASPAKPMSDKQRGLIFHLLNSRHIFGERQRLALQANGIEDTSTMTSAQASEIIDKLQSGTFQIPSSTQRQSIITDNVVDVDPDAEISVDDIPNFDEGDDGTSNT